MSKIHLKTQRGIIQQSLHAHTTLHYTEDCHGSPFIASAGHPQCKCRVERAHAVATECLSFECFQVN